MIHTNRPKSCAECIKARFCFDSENSVGCHSLGTSDPRLLIPSNEYYNHGSMNSIRI